MRNVRKRQPGHTRPNAMLSRLPGKTDLAVAALSALLVPPSRLWALGRRLKAKLHAMGLCPTCRPKALAVGVGGMAAESRGRVLLTSWLLGWARARNVAVAVAASPGDGRPPVVPYQLTPGDDCDVTGIEAALIVGYAPDTRLILDTDPIRAARTAERTFAPKMLVLQDALADPRLKKDIELAILTADDLGAGWDRVFPAGHWRRDASTLAQADAFCVFAGPLAQHAALEAAKKRLAPFDKPVFGLSFDIWRWHGPEKAVAGEELAGAPYVAVLAESDRELLPEMLRRQIGVAPRIIFFVHDRHRFSHQDFENLRADAARFKARNILTAPRLALKLAQHGGVLDGYAMWTYDPEVVFGPSLTDGTPFLTWWEKAFEQAARKRNTP
ncbi:tetraacyldisaccharide 4'-kinase [Solidesulfovibrio sp. C21]|uniref:tetraacyldisaccharide 4'-kinase n=1 Tax=Solidesulfovibrio sp. C21 TaxID=3398613 RepID=UPI0039FC60D0